LRLDEIIAGNDVVQRHLAQERQALLAISPMARSAIEREILPQIESGVTGPAAVDSLRDSTKAEIERAFRAKDPVYTRLISYKSIDQSDTQYLSDLLTVMDEWATKTRDTLGDDDAVKLKIEVESEVESEVKVKSDGGVDVEVKEIQREVSPPPLDSVSFEPPLNGLRNLGAPSGEEEIPLADEDDFDFGDVRL
jgi:hypothetical protein